MGVGGREDVGFENGVGGRVEPREYLYIVF